MNVVYIYIIWDTTFTKLWNLFLILTAHLMYPYCNLNLKYFYLAREQILPLVLPHLSPN